MFIAKNNATVIIAQSKFFACFDFSILNLNIKYYIYIGQKRNSKGQFILKDNGELNITIPDLLKIVKILIISAIIIIIVFSWIFVLIQRIKDEF